VEVTNNEIRWSMDAVALQAKLWELFDLEMRSPNMLPKLLTEAMAFYELYPEIESPADPLEDHLNRSDIYLNATWYFWLFSGEFDAFLFTKRLPPDDLKYTTAPSYMTEQTIELLNEICVRKSERDRWSRRDAWQLGVRYGWLFKAKYLAGHVREAGSDLLRKYWNNAESALAAILKSQKRVQPPSETYRLLQRIAYFNNYYNCQMIKSHGHWSRTMRAIATKHDMPDYHNLLFLLPDEIRAAGINKELAQRRRMEGWAVRADGTGRVAAIK